MLICQRVVALPGITSTSATNCMYVGLVHLLQTYGQTILLQDRTMWHGKGTYGKFCRRALYDP